jgi:tetratricopeptide (TPR) repeat protein
MKVKRIRYPYALAASVALITSIVYLPALRNGFVGWDDNFYIFDNPFLKTLAPDFVNWAFSTFWTGNWHPLTWISYSLDYAVWGLNPLGYHLTNVILHAVNTLLVTLLALRLLKVSQQTSTDDDLSRALVFDRTALIAGGVAGLLFGLHPLHVESVAWVSERKDLLCALFFLFGITAYVKYAGSRGAGLRSQESQTGVVAEAGRKNTLLNKHYLFTLGFFVLALLSKPMAVTFPVVLLILDWFPFERIYSLRTFKAAFVEKLPFFVLSLISSVATMFAQNAGEAITPLTALPATTRILVAVKALITYLAKMIWPRDLLPYYLYPNGVSLLSLEYLFAVLLVIGITAACIIAAQKQKFWLAAWGYYVVALIPVLGIVQVGEQSMADRYTYLPSLGPFVIMGLVVARVATKAISSTRGMIVKLPYAAASVVFIFLSYLTIQQIGIWKDSLNLWSYVIEKEPSAPRAYDNRGTFFARTGQVDKALADYDKIIVLRPFNPYGYLKRGTLFASTGQVDKALADYEVAIALNPFDFDAYYHRGSVYAGMGQVDKAIADYEKAIALNPSYYEAYFNLGALYGKTGFFDRARGYFDKSIAINPRHAESYNNRGQSYFYTDQLGRALEDFNKAIALKQDYASAYYNRGRLYLRTGNKGLAVSDFRKACELGFENGCKELH